MFIRSHGISDRGKVRSSNEDAFFVDEAHKVFAVADGLGGLPGGARASNRIVELLAHTFESIDLEKEQVNLTELVVGIHRIVAREGKEAHPYTGTGSTLTMGQIIDNQFAIAHVGDSAAYRWRAGELTKLTIDHTMEQELLNRLGESARDTMPPEYPHTLTRCIGQDDDLLVDQTRIEISPGDRLLLCSDGLNKVLTDEEIEAGMGESDDPKLICERFVKSTYENRAPDNVTLIVAFIE